jgi:hypothetical protein
MSTSIIWEKHNIEFFTFLRPKPFRLSSILKVDGKEVANTPKDSAYDTADITCTITHNDEPIRLEIKKVKSGVKRPIFLGGSFDYFLKIKDYIVHKGRHRVENAWIFYLGSFVILALLIYFYLKLIPLSHIILLVFGLPILLFRCLDWVDSIKRTRAMGDVIGLVRALTSHEYSGESVKEEDAEAAALNEARTTYGKNVVVRKIGYSGYGSDIYGNTIYNVYGVYIDNDTTRMPTEECYHYFK